VNPLFSLLLIGVAYVEATLLKHYARAFAGWRFLPLMACCWALTILAMVIVVSLLTH